MIARNEEPNEETEERQLTPQEMRTLLHILVTVVRGIDIPKRTFDEYAKDPKINITFDEETQVWKIWVPQPRKRGIVVPKKKIIQRKIIQP
ncbi:MAG TPA: hypothetical protein VMW24_12615 [Sedimentisphaerales bacterium]|nr:hypothetical protein [Sedimentisphaerales bacterium]